MKKWAFVLLLAALCQICIADGKFFPTSTEYTPGIPRQRGIVVYRDDVETLIIDNYVQAGKGSLAWVVPVPTKPTHIAALDNGIYDSLDIITKPTLAKKISRREVIRQIAFLLIYSIGVIGLCLCIRAKNRKKSLMILVFFLVPSLFIASVFTLANHARILGNKSAGFQESVAEVGSWTVGSYSAKAIKATNTQDLVKWLTDNDYTKPDQYAETMAIDEYIKKGWHFVVAKIRNDAGGKLNPHPLAITFKTNMPVYPMKLTRFNPSPDTILEIIVISKNTARIKSLEKVFCSKLKKVPLAKYDPVNGVGNNSFQYKPEMALDHIKTGRGQLGRYLWDNCVITKFHKKMSNRDMRKDILISNDKYKYYRAKYYSPAAIASLQFVRVFKIATLLPIAIGLIILSWKKTKPIGIALLVIIFLLMAIWPMTVWLQVKPIPDFMDIEGMRGFHMLRPYINEFDYFLADKKVKLSTANLEQQYLRFVSSTYNYDGLRGKKGIGPNQYQIKNINGKPTLVVYGPDGYGYPFSVEGINETIKKYHSK